MSGKGSAPRPYSIPKEDFDARHEAIFGKPKRERYVPPPLPVVDGPEGLKHTPRHNPTYP